MKEKESGICSMPIKLVASLLIRIIILMVAHCDYAKWSGTYEPVWAASGCANHDVRSRRTSSGGITRQLANRLET